MQADFEDEIHEEEEDGLYEHHAVVADKGQSLIRIDKFLFDRLPNLSRNKIQQAAKADCLRVNGVAVKSNYKIKPLDKVSMVLPYPKRELELIPEQIPLDILYEDDTLIVVNKAAGMVVHPGYGNYTGTLVNAMLGHFEHLPEKPLEPLRPGLVHRIDKNTSGILVMAKTEHALAHLANQFFERTTQRRYLALVWGDLAEPSGTITGHIGRSLKNRKVMSVFPDGEFGKHAITHYQVEKRFNYVTLVSCKLETGRTHQIRAHFSYLKHPLFNDPEYGGDKILKGTTFTKYKQFIANCFEAMPRHALHAQSLGFKHPVSGKPMFFECDLPQDFKTVLEKWEGYAKQGLTQSEQ